MIFDVEVDQRRVNFYLGIIGGRDWLARLRISLASIHVEWSVKMSTCKHGRRVEQTVLTDVAHTLFQYFQSWSSVAYEAEAKVPKVLR